MQPTPKQQSHHWFHHFFLFISRMYIISYITDKYSPTITQFIWHETLSSGFLYAMQEDGSHWKTETSIFAWEPQPVGTWNESSFPMSLNRSSSNGLFYSCFHCFTATTRQFKTLFISIMWTVAVEMYVRLQIQMVCIYASRTIYSDKNPIQATLQADVQVSTTNETVWDLFSDLCSLFLFLSPGK